MAEVEGVSHTRAWGDKVRTWPLPGVRCSQKGPDASRVHRLPVVWGADSKGRGWGQGTQGEPREPCCDVQEGKDGVWARAPEQGRWV